MNQITSLSRREKEREGEGGRERKRGGGRERGREREKERGREGERERERGGEGGREGERETDLMMVLSMTMAVLATTTSFSLRSLSRHLFRLWMILAIHSGWEDLSSSL